MADENYSYAPKYVQIQNYILQRSSLASTRPGTRSLQRSSLPDSLMSAA